MVEEGGRTREAAVGLKQTGWPSFAGANYAVYKDRAFDGSVNPGKRWGCNLDL